MSLSGNVFGFFLLFFQNGHGIIYGMDHRDFALKRSSAILFEKFLRYLLPAMLTMAALSMITALILGLVILAGEFCFLDPLADFICKNKNILAE